MNKPDTKMRGCKGGCGQRYWCEKPGICPDCRARAAAVARLNLHSKRPPVCHQAAADQERRVLTYSERVEQGLPLFA